MHYRGVLMKRSERFATDNEMKTQRFGVPKAAICAEACRFQVRGDIRANVSYAIQTSVHTNRVTHVRLRNTLPGRRDRLATRVLSSLGLDDRSDHVRCLGFALHADYLVM